MQAHPTFRLSRWIPATLTLALLLAVVMGGFGLPHAMPMTGATSVAPGTVLHWRDASHDWLLVGDGESNQLSIYNAIDGRLVRRVALRHGLSDTRALMQRDGRLFVVGDDGRMGELALPQLPMVAFNSP